MTSSPVPPIPDEDRYVRHEPVSSTTDFAIPFPLFGDATDVAVYVNAVKTTGFTVVSASGTPLALLPRPVTDAVVRLNVGVSGVAVEIYGARRPRRTAQASAPFSTRDFNVVFSDVIATMREIWSRAVTALTLRGTDGSGYYDAGGNRIVNLGAPTQDNDAISKAYADANYGGSETDLAAVQAAAANATSAASSASASAAAAAASAANAAAISGVDLSGYMQKAQNLNDLANKGTARTNLSVYSTAEVDAIAAGKAATSHTQAASTISDSTAAGRALLTAADAAAQRTLLGVGTGTSVASTDISDATSLGRSLITAASQAAARTALGLAALATKATAALSDLAALSGASKLMGSSSSGAAVTEITLGSGLSMSGSVLSATGGTTTLGAVNSLAFCVLASTTSISAGSTIAGSSLRYGSAAPLPGTGTPSGTWQAMGNASTTFDSGTGVTSYYGTLFVRIA